MLLRRGIRVGGNWQLALTVQGVAGASPMNEFSKSSGKADGHAVLLRNGRPKLVMSLVEPIDSRLGTARATNARGAAIVHLAHAVRREGLVRIRVHVSTTAAVAVRRRGHVRGHGRGGCPAHTAHVRAAGGAAWGRLMRLNTRLQGGRGLRVDRRVRSRTHARAKGRG